MVRWGIALAAVGLLGMATQAQAQVPTGGNGLKFVPVDTTRNLATPLAIPNIPQPKLSMQDKIHNAFASILPFINKRQPTLPGPQGMTTKLPKLAQGQLPAPSAPTFKLPDIPKLPQPVSATIR